MVIKYLWFIISAFYIYLVYGFIFDIEIFILIISFVWYHIYISLQTILNDYFHIKFIKIIFLLFLRISIFLIIRYFFEFFL
uniref:SdhD n=1 Tax=Plocamiocolax pulvinatus TaxID=35206 RepID=E5Q3G4_9FLOR|nr:SdhD [Plocamiocolax pulvinata]ADR03247.1 SdhD [Plocamiocolax pulvinata]